MKTSNYRVVPLRTEVAEAARRAATSGAPDHAVVIADSPQGYPCRHCLRWVQPGERVILFPFAAIHQAVLIRRLVLSLFTPSHAHVMRRRGSSRQTFAKIVSSAL